MFVVTMITKKAEIDVYGRIQEIELSYADGMIGALPVFDDYEKALEFCGDARFILEIEKVNHECE